MVRLRVPAQLEFRDMALRVVAASCKMVGDATIETWARRSFENEAVTAFGEAFNNVVLHGYAGRPGDVEIEIDVSPEQLVIRLFDHGVGFDVAGVQPPDLDHLPTSGLGLFIMRAFTDEVSYRSGCPNVLTLRKRFSPRPRSGDDERRSAA